jgi:predicted nucleic acid-binding protein
MMRRLKIYIDTSVIGGVFDAEFCEPTALFFAQARDGRFNIVISSLLAEEVKGAPQNVRDFYMDILKLAESVTPSSEAMLLQKAYLDAGVVTAKWSDDALHVATATVADCDMIVSWNFRHLVHYDKKRKYNAVNALHGYSTVDIITPSEVIEYEEDL